MTRIKSAAVIAGYAIGGLALIAVVMFASRTFTTATVRLQVERATPTVMCAKIVTTDGAALSCWKE